MVVMEKERQRIEAQENMSPKEMEGAGACEERPVQAAVDPPAEVDVVGSLQDEVEAFMHRDQIDGAGPREISEYLELAGRGFDNTPEDQE